MTQPAYDGSEQPQRGDLSALQRDIIVRVLRQTLRTSMKSGAATVNYGKLDPPAYLFPGERELIADACELLDPRGE